MTVVLLMRVAQRWVTVSCVAFAAVMLCSGCGLVFRAGQVIRQKQQQAAARPVADGSYAKGLQPVPSGPGIIVCEPVATPAQDDLTAFGAGCGRWLHLVVGGHGEFGQTPFWGHVDDARLQMGQANLHLRPDEAAQVARIIGATHAATGEIRSVGNKVTLTYRLHPVLVKASSPVKALGLPIVLTGTREQIVAQLPEVGRALVRRLGVKTPRVPAVKATASEMAFLGGVPWKARQPVAPATGQRLLALSKRVPLAGLLYERSGVARSDNAPQLKAAVQHIMQATPDNVLLIADIARFSPRLLDDWSQKVDRLSRQFPNNYLLHATALFRHQRQGRWAQAQQAAEQAVRAAPRNALAWIDLGELLSDRSQTIRKARYARQISLAQWQQIGPLYAHWLDAASRAAELDPEDAYIWSRVSCAAAFYGNGQRADQAFQKAMQKDKGSSGIYSPIYGWGLQLYQPKWYGGSDGPAKLLKVAQAAIANCPPGQLPSTDLVEAIEDGGLKNSKEELLTAAVRRHPKDAVVNYELGAVYHYVKRNYRKAERYYQVALTADPQYARALSSLADLHFFVKNDPVGAERLYRQAVAVSPRSGYLRANLARYLALTGKAQEARAELQRAQQDGFADKSHPVWSVVQ